MMFDILKMVHFNPQITGAFYPQIDKSVVENPEKEEVQPDGRIKKWGYIHEEGKYLRVILLPDGKTIHNAFFDRRFKATK